MTDVRPVSRSCPSCGALVEMEPYDIGSGPELACPHCEWCWGANGQPLRPIALSTTPGGTVPIVPIDFVRVAVTVHAGTTPGDPDPEHSRSWTIGAEEWEALADDPYAQRVALAELCGRAHGYATLLMLQPDLLTWVRTELVWL